jgi:DNA invertase Pin-like site-specific DNA recombinase
MAKEKRVILYARVSTTKDQKPEIQIDELRKYSTARGWSIVEEIIDHGFSGSTDKRPGYKRLLELTRSRKIDVIAVVKLDRLFRSMKHVVIALNEFTELGVEFVSVRDQIDMSSSSGKLLLHLLAAFGEFERSLIIERTMMGLEHAKSKGKVLGRPRAHDFKLIQDLYSQGMALRKIQREIGCSIGVVYRAIEAVPKTPQNTDQLGPLETRGCDGK